jgi:hypothetical protein
MSWWLRFVLVLRDDHEPSALWEGRVCQTIRFISETTSYISMAFNTGDLHWNLYSDCVFISCEAWRFHGDEDSTHGLLGYDIA